MMMAESKPVLIKKYGNRRLYDTETSAYINLEDLAHILKKGRNVQVVDARTHEDLTRAVLLQLLLERERQNVECLPVELLKELIVLGDTPARRWFDLSMRVSLEMLRRLKKSGMAGLSGWSIPWMGMGMDLQEMLASMMGGDKKGSAVGSTVSAEGGVVGMNGDEEEAPEEASAGTSHEEHEDQDEKLEEAPEQKSGDVALQLEELRRRLESLEASLSTKGGKK